MAQLKDSVVAGNLRVTDKVLANGVQTNVINAPTASGGTTYGPGTNGQVLKSNGTTVYWTSDNNSDTKNTAGTTNKTGTKMFIAAAKEQSANPVTYSNSNVYIGTDNCLYSGGTKVLTAHQDISGKVTGPASATNNAVAIFDGTGGKTIKNSGFTIGTSVPSGAKFTDTTYESKAAASGGTAVSLVTTGEKYTWNNKSNLAIGTTASTAMAGNTTVTNVAISANTTTNANYPVVFATSNKDTTAAKNEGVQKSGAKFYFNPSTGNVVSTQFNGYTLGAACAKGVTDNSSSTAVTSSDTNLITGRTLYYAGYTKLSIGTTASTAMAGNTNVNNVAIAANTTTDASYPVVFATSNTGTTGAKKEGLQKSGAKFYFNPSTGALDTGGTINGVDLANVVTDAGYQLYIGDSPLGPPCNKAMFSLVKNSSYPHQMCYHSNYIHEEAVVSAAAGSWTTATPPTQTIHVTNMGSLASSLIEVGLASTATSEEIDAAAAAKIMCTAQDIASITLTCYGTTPTINIPILVVNWG